MKSMRTLLTIMWAATVIMLSIPTFAQDAAAPAAPVAAPEATTAAPADAAAPAEAAPADAAAAPAAPALNSGDTAWMLTSTLLVLMMTIPGLALFYGGMVRKKNVLATIMQSFAITCLVTIMWMIVGYSFAFTDGGGLNDYLGGFDRFFLAGLDAGALASVAGVTLTIPETVFFCF